ncbi:MAG: hypothetical protein IKE41_02650 [Clostridia bacterium]|nr:hypothetical protein [Clostridia bacterium]MBR2734735.1 hypothetical protein [Clostridia bacterium]
MNEFEQKALETLSDEEREKVTGGRKVDATTELTTEECNNLKNMVNIDDLIPRCKYGGPGMFKPFNPEDPYHVATDYGAPGIFKTKKPMAKLPDDTALSPTPPTEEYTPQDTEV